MTHQAANALLKTLEEPPPETHLILVAHRIAGMLPTIVSRCQKVPFFPLPLETAAEILSRHPDAGGSYPPAVIRLACATAGGSPGRALALLPGIEDERNRWLAVFAGGSPREAVDLAETFKGEGNEPGRLAAPLALARDLALLSSGGGTAIMNADLRDKLSAVAARPPARGWDAAFRELLAISRMPPQPQKRLMLEAFFFGMRRKG
jgi:DNA polymerase-3 subunit delta'